MWKNNFVYRTFAPETAQIMRLILDEILAQCLNRLFYNGICHLSGPLRQWRAGRQFPPLGVAFFITEALESPILIHAPARRRPLFQMAVTRICISGAGAVPQ
jgi:hypothetical protein